MSLADCQALTFDCYGTLVDWRGGLLEAVRGALPGGAALDAPRFLDQRQEEEARLQKEAFRPYREVVSASVTAALQAQGLTGADAAGSAAAASIGDWPPFPDTREALEIIGRGRELVIVSNVDEADIRRTVARIGVSFDHLITAERVRSYKPLPAHFHAALKALGRGTEEVLHVAQSLYHDIGVAVRLGLQTAWVNRLAEPLPADLSPDLVVPDMRGLAEAIGAGGERSSQPDRVVNKL